MSLPDSQQFSKIMHRWFANEVDGWWWSGPPLPNVRAGAPPRELRAAYGVVSLADSLEARSPFLDHKVIEFSASLPEHVKMRRFETKSLLKKVAARLVPVVEENRAPIGHVSRIDLSLRRR